MLSLENLCDGQTETTWLTAHATDQIHWPNPLTSVLLIAAYGVLPYVIHSYISIPKDQTSDFVVNRL